MSPPILANMLVNSVHDLDRVVLTRQGIPSCELKTRFPSPGAIAAGRIIML